MLEHPPQLNITQSALTPRVADYFDNLLAQRDAILARHHLTPETAEKFCDLQSTDEDRETILALYEKIVYVIEHKQIPPNPEKQEKYRVAQEIMKEEFFGTEAIEKTFNIHLSPEDIPEIPFTIEELDRANELGQFLILRVDKTDDDTPLTMDHMLYMLVDEFEKENLGRVLLDITWYQAEDFFTKETATLSWALVSKEVIPDSSDKNYLQQTEQIIDYLKRKVFEGMIMPKEYQEAIHEFDERQSAIHAMMSIDQQKAADMLAKLSINQLTRQSLVECFYDMLVYVRNSKQERFMEDMRTWTRNRCASDGNLVSIGHFGSVTGAYVRSDEPKTTYPWLGVALSRLR